MIGNSEQLQQSGPKSLVHKASYLPTPKPRIRRVSRHRHHQSLENSKSFTKPQSTNIIHVKVRKPESNQPSNDKSVNPAENLLTFSSILSTPYHSAQFNPSSFRQSSSKKSTHTMLSLNETNISSNRPSILETSQNTSNNNGLSINSRKNKKLHLTNTEEQMNTSQQHGYNEPSRHKTLTVKSPRVIPSQNNPTKQTIRILNENNNKNETRRSNKLDLMKTHSNFSRKKQNGKIKKKRKSCCWPSSRSCVFGSILGTLLLGAVIGATVAGVLSQQKLTTTITTATTTTVTTATSTTTTSVSTTTTTTSISTTTSATSSTTTTTTTTTNINCGSTCVNTTVSTSSRLAFYSFDNVTTDVTGNYSTSGIASPTYVSGWVGPAISFSYFNAQFLSAPYIPLNSRSFAIDFCFYATNLSTGWDFSFAGQNESQAFSKCLFLNIRNTKLCFGFYSADVAGNTNILTNRWYHAAFVYDNSTQPQYIYLNGLLDNSASASPLLTTTGAFTIGGARIGGSTSSTVYYSGYIDHFTISSRAKSACEIYLDATLACYFTFDSVSSIDDSGPNFLTVTNTGATSTTGRVNQALQFSSTLSYITINGISALISTNTVFTISMWINPTNVAGGATLIHASTQSDGQGACLAMWGLTSTGILSVNVIDSSNNTIPATASSVIPLNTWTHVAQTFSTTNGNYLYINGTLVTSVSTATGRPIGPYAFLGASPSGTSYCKAGSISMGQFYGSIDEYRVYGHELNATDICRLANP